MKVKTTAPGVLVGRDAPRRFTLAGRYPGIIRTTDTRNYLAIVTRAIINHDK